MNKTNIKLPKKLQEAVDQGKLILYDDIVKSWSPEKRARIEAITRRRRIARILREIRNDTHLSQTALAKKMQVKREYISRIESGTQNITLDTLYKIGDAVGKELELKFN